MKRNPGRLQRTGPVVTLLAIACAAMLVSAVTRWGHSLSHDEPTTANRIRLELPALLDDCRANGASPLYYLLLKPWAALFGESERALRGFSVLLLGAAVLVAGGAAWRFGGPRAGVITGVLLAASDLAAYQGANARPYALLLLLASAACALALLVADDATRGGPLRVNKRRAGWLAGSLGLVYAIGLLVHPLFMAVVGATALAGVVVARGRVRWHLVAAAALGTIGSQVAWPIGSLGVATRAIDWVPPLSWRAVADAAAFLWGSLRGMLLAGWLAALMLMGAVAAWSSSQGRMRAASGDRAARLVGLVALLTTTAPVALSLVKPVFVPDRTLTLALPALCMWAAFVMARSPWLPATWALLAVLLAGAARHASLPNAANPVPTRESLERILADAECHDVFVLGHLSSQEVAYYLRRLGAGRCIERVSFPAETSTHTGWFDTRFVRTRGRQVAGEAEALASAVSDGAGSVWVFEGGTDEARAATALVRQSLARRRPGVEIGGVRGSFFDTVVRYPPAGSED